MRAESRRVSVELLERRLLDGVHEFEGEPERMRVDLGLVPVFVEERPLLGLAGLLDWRASGCLSALLRSGLCTAAPGEQVLLPCDRRLPVDRLVLVGLGRREDFDHARAQAVASQLVEISRGIGARTVLIALPTEGIDRALAEATFEGLLGAIDAQARDDPASPSVDEPGSEGSERELPAGEALAPEPEPEPAAPASHDDEQPEQDGGIGEVRWWVAADEAVAPRLRRVLSGPPRAARGGASLHT